MKKENIQILNHVGTWYVIGESVYKDKPVYLLEHETYGDEAASLIVDENLIIILEDVFNGFDDLECLQEEEKEEENNTRICSECGKVMTQGYCIENGLAYYCSDECLLKNMKMESYLELYDDGNGDTYWTEWEEEEVW